MSKGGLRPYTIGFDVSRKEREAVRDMAAEKSMSVSEFLRYVLGLYRRAMKRTIGEEK